MRNFGTLALGASFASVLTLLGTSPASAAIQLCYVTGATQPQCPATTSNVNVNTETGLVIGGHLNDNPAQLLTFTGTEALAGDGSGQASVGALDTLLNTAVTFALTGATFNLATFNLSPLSGNNPNEATSVQVSYIPTFGGSPLAFTLDGNGNNFFGIYGDAGEQLQSITFGNFLSSGNGIESINQVRVGGVQSDLVINPLGPVPEPATWTLLLVGFGAVGASLRTRKMKTGRRLRVA
jgi:hypothetical protein